MERREAPRYGTLEAGLRGPPAHPRRYPRCRGSPLAGCARPV